VKTSRQQILAYIRSQSSVTAAELSQAMGMTRANARHHLEILVDEGVVQQAASQPGGGRGRPAKAYCLAEVIRGDNLASLSRALFAEIQPHDEEMFLRLAERIAENIEDLRLSGKMTERIIQAIDALNQRHYDARWEAHSGTVRVIFSHCPYRQVVEAVPELCRLDQELLALLTGSRVEFTGKLVPDWRGGTMCTFRLQANSIRSAGRTSGSLSNPKEALG
jgi:predicted ArsR family transcriptional regulator